MVFLGISSPGYIAFFVGLIATEGFFAFFITLIYKDLPKKSPTTKCDRNSHFGPLLYPWAMSRGPQN